LPLNQGIKMPHLINYIRHMNDDQAAVVRKYLCGGVYKNGEESKEKQLFEKILSSKGTDILNKELSLDIYGCLPNERYRKLKSRLMKKIMEASCSEEHLEKPHLFSYREMIYIRLKKQMMQCRVVNRTINKYKLDLLSPLLDDVILQAGKEELFDVMVEALKLKRDAVEVTRGQREIKQAEKEIELFESLHSGIEKAINLIFLINCRFKFGSAGAVSIDPVALETLILELQQLCKKANSYSAKYFLRLLEVYRAEMAGQYQEALKHCIEMLDMRDLNNVSFSEAMQPDNYLLMARFSLMTFSYEQANEYSRKAIESSKPFSPNFLLAMEYEFLSMYYLDRLDKSLDLIDNMVVYLPSGDETLSARFAFYRSCIYFKLGRFNESYKELYNANGLIKDKAGWAIGYKYLQIMLQAEFKNVFPTSASVDSLRKHIHRNSEIKLTNRDKLIITALRKLERKSFKRESVDPRMQGYLKQLSSSDSQVAWTPLSHELIPVHDWIYERSKKSKSTHYALAV
jgi:tetratricopeptide (TPR) repeat protein